MLKTREQHDLFQSGIESAHRIARAMIRRLRCKHYDLDDATQDSLLGLAAAAGDYDPARATCPFKTYANTKCHQRIIDGWRRAVGRGSVGSRVSNAPSFSELSAGRGRTDDQSDVLETLASGDCEPLEAMIIRADEARKRRMCERIKRLAARAGRAKSVYGHVLTAIFDCDMSQAEAAALYGVSQSSVNHLIKKMRTEALCA